MRTLKIMIAAVLLAAVALPARPNAYVFPGLDSEKEEREKERADAKVEREESLYEAANDHLDDHEWSKAAVLFDRVAQLHMAHADSALFWLAYSQDKMGQRSESLSTLVDLQKHYRKSRWVEAGKQLEVEIPQAAAQHIK